MKLIEKMKRFYLKKQSNGGFTLVELIVVIAILAILAGVAVPAYSGYVEKANKQADVQLVSDIEKALELAYYNRDLPEGSAGFIMLSPNEGESFADEDDEGNSLTAVAMEKVFGTDWIDTMQLKYESWGISWNTISYEDAAVIVNSNFVQDYTPDELMDEVQTLIDTVNGLSDVAGVSLYNMYQYTDSNGEINNAIADVMDEYNITKGWDELSAEEQSNILVLATASSVSSGKDFRAVTDIIPSYALYTAYAKENIDFADDYEAFKNSLAEITTKNADEQYDAIKAAYNSLQIAAGSEFETWRTTVSGENSTVGEEHMAAFNAIMSGVGYAMNDKRDDILENLNDPNLFTTGMGNELYKDYLNSAYATASNEAMLEFIPALKDGESLPGAVIVQYSVNKGILYIANSFPND